MLIFNRNFLSWVSGTCHWAQNHPPLQKVESFILHAMDPYYLHLFLTLNLSTTIINNCLPPPVTLPEAWHRENLALPTLLSRLLIVGPYLKGAHRIQKKTSKMSRAFNAATFLMVYYLYQLCYCKFRCLKKNTCMEWLRFTIFYQGQQNKHPNLLKQHFRVLQSAISRFFFIRSWKKHKFEYDGTLKVFRMTQPARGRKNPWNLGWPLLVHSHKALL